MVALGVDTGIDAANTRAISQVKSNTSLSQGFDDPLPPPPGNTRARIGLSVGVASLVVILLPLQSRCNTISYPKLRLPVWQPFSLFAPFDTY